MKYQRVFSKKMLGAVIFTAISLNACSMARIPEPMGYPYSWQHKSQAAEHWNVLAWDVANRINEQLVLSGNANRAVHVEYNCGSDAVPCKPDETTPFNEAFRDLLITRLYDLRVPTTVEKQKNSLEITYKVQLLRHDARRVPTILPGVISTITSAVAVLRNAPSGIQLIAAGAFADFANSTFDFHSHCEVIITTTIAKRGRYLFRSSDIYYINDPDFWHYLESFPEAEGVNFAAKSLQEDETKGEIPQVLPIMPPLQPETDQEETQPVFQPKKESI